MTVPEEVRDELRALVRGRAKEAHWDGLLQRRRTILLDSWVTDPAIGGVLDGYMPRSKVRAYIKDVLLRMPRGPPTSVPKGLALRTVRRWYRKPDGAVGSDGRLCTWGNARDWKAILLTAYERIHEGGYKPGPIILADSAAKFSTPESRVVVDRAARALGLQPPLWK